MLHIKVDFTHSLDESRLTDSSPLTQKQSEEPTYKGSDDQIMSLRAIQVRNKLTDIFRGAESGKTEQIDLTDQPATILDELKGLCVGLKDDYKLELILLAIRNKNLTLFTNLSTDLSDFITDRRSIYRIVECCDECDSSDEMVRALNLKLGIDHRDLDYLSVKFVKVLFVSKFKTYDEQQSAKLLDWLFVNGDPKAIQYAASKIISNDRDKSFARMKLVMCLVRSIRSNDSIFDVVWNQFLWSTKSLLKEGTVITLAVTPQCNPRAIATILRYIATMRTTSISAACQIELESSELFCPITLQHELSNRWFLLALDSCGINLIDAFVGLRAGDVLSNTTYSHVKNIVDQTLEMRKQLVTMVTTVLYPDLARLVVSYL